MSQKYKESGVDISLGDQVSALAAKYAKSTFSGRKGKIGQPVDLPGGFAGVLDFGEYYLVQCCDTVGTKIDLAKHLGDFSQLGPDLLAMVSDDAVCLGAEVVSITNTFETNTLHPQEIEAMMKSLAKVCQEQNIVISGGEIAEVGEKIDGTSWGADAIGIVEKEKVITGENIQCGDSILSLQEVGFRCNGFSLIRKVLRDNYVDDALFKKRCLRGSTVYHSAILDICGRYRESPRGEIHGIAHITGGGIVGNLSRILRNNFGAKLPCLFAPGEEMKKLADMGGVSLEELYHVWNGGNGMLVVCPPHEEQNIIRILKERGIVAQKSGEITDSGKIEITAWNGEELLYDVC
jgi:phosphoribosylformylglycinamidine cyclo-ligase